MKKKLYVSFDPGFNGCKMVIGGSLYLFPFSIQDITDELADYENARKSNDFTRSIYENRTYLFGDIAFAYMKDPRKMRSKNRESEILFSMERFTSKIFEVAFNTFLGYGLVSYANEHNWDLAELADTDLIVGVALPHAYFKDLIPSVTPVVKGSHNVTIQIGADSHDLTFHVAKAYINAQAICVLSKELSDDRGVENPDSPLYDCLPTIVIDAGYKTIGIFEMDDTYAIRQAESNQQYSMLKVDEGVAASLRQFDSEFSPLMVESMSNKNESFRYFDQKTGMKEVSVLDARSAELEKTAAQLFRYLESKFSHFQYDRSILVGGGTGAAYFPFIKQSIDKWYPPLSAKTILADSPFNSLPCPPVYAVAVGMYKSLLTIDNTQEETS